MYKVTLGDLKRSINGLCLIKKVNKDGISISEQTSDLYKLNLFLNILYAHNVANLGFWKI